MPVFVLCVFVSLPVPTPLSVPVCVSMCKLMLVPLPMFMPMSMPPPMPPFQPLDSDSIVLCCRLADLECSVFWWGSACMGLPLTVCTEVHLGWLHVLWTFPFGRTAIGLALFGCVLIFSADFTRFFPFAGKCLNSPGTGLFHGLIQTLCAVFHALLRLVNTCSCPSVNVSSPRTLFLPVVGQLSCIIFGGDPPPQHTHTSSSKKGGKNHCNMPGHAMHH